MTIWVVLLFLAAVVWLFITWANVKMWRTTPPLSNTPSTLPDGVAWPKLSVLVPSRDEEKAIEAATRSLLALDYPHLEVVAIDDRSTDRTGAILDALAKEDPRLTVVHVHELPEGWLGKNHANHLGTQKAGGDWLLFTDGDVLFTPDALKRAIAFGITNQLGHVVAMPHFIAPGFMERAFQSSTFIAISIRFRTWGLKDAKTSGYVGVGAFNLVRAADYQRLGGHVKLAMEVADDMKLGMMLRRSGVRQGMTDSRGAVSVRWQEGLKNSFTGILKNAFSGVDWRWELVLALLVGHSLVTFVPWVALFLAPTIELRELAAFSVVMPMLLHSYCATRMARGNGLEGLTHPLMSTGVTLALFCSALLAHWRNGITWRGTHYPLKALRAKCVREKDYPSDGAVGWE